MIINTHIYGGSENSAMDYDAGSEISMVVGIDTDGLYSSTDSADETDVYIGMDSGGFYFTDGEE